MRWDAKVVLMQEHSMVVEADTEAEAQERTLEQMGNRVAEKWEVEIHLEQGVT